MMNSSKLSLFFTVILTYFRAVEAERCLLCGSYSALPVADRWGDRFPDGQSCQDIYLQFITSEIDTTSGVCTSQINKARNACCNPNAARPSASSANASPGASTGGPNSNAGGAVAAVVSNAPPRLANYTGEVGDEPICPICGTEEYPGKPNAFIVARYVGEYTCAQLYSRGYHGMTPNFMCGPLQDFARSVCGCGNFNPACAQDPTKCFGRPNYVQPYTVPWLEPGYDRYARRVVPPQSSAGASQAQSNNGKKPESRNLRGSDEADDLSSPAKPSITDFHFETRD